MFNVGDKIIVIDAFSSNVPIGLNRSEGIITRVAGLTVVAIVDGSDVAWNFRNQDIKLIESKKTLIINRKITPTIKKLTEEGIIDLEGKFTNYTFVNQFLVHKFGKEMIEFLDDNREGKE